jgi:hypothetical protein
MKTGGCIFHLGSGERGSTCELLHVFGRQRPSTDMPEQFEETHCKSDAFMSCPLFQEFEIGLVRAGLKLEYPSAA